MSRQAFQVVRQMLPLMTFAASGTPGSIDTGLIKTKHNGMPAHVAAIDFVCRFTPTLNSGTVTPEEAQLAMPKITIKDGVKTHFDNKASVLRLLEALERSKLPAEFDALSTTEQGVFVRRWTPGVAGLKNGLVDSLLPPGAFNGGNITVTWSALTDVDAQCTALTLTVQAIVHLVVFKDRVVFGTQWEKAGYIIVNEQRFAVHPSLIAYLALLDAATPAAITAGDFANIQVRGTGVDEDPIHCSDLTQLYGYDMGCGLESQVRGEPRSATDDNQKVQNGTALAAASAVLQPLVWTPPGGELAKLQHHSQDGISLKWDGTQAGGYALVVRAIERDETSLGKYIGLAEQALNFKLPTPKVMTEDGRDYVGRRSAFMPLVSKF